MLISNTIRSGNKSELAIPPVGSNAFIFKIDQDCITSAGVYDNTKKLIRTLWSGRTYTSGLHTEQWDGTDDEGNKALKHKMLPIPSRCVFKVTSNYASS